jgi:hypothetical protein
MFWIACGWWGSIEVATIAQRGTNGEGISQISTLKTAIADQRSRSGS